MATPTKYLPLKNHRLYSIVGMCLYFVDRFSMRLVRVNLWCLDCGHPGHIESYVCTFDVIELKGMLACFIAH